MGKHLGWIVGCGIAFVAAIHSARAAEILPAKFHFLPLEPDNSLSVKAEGTATERPAWGKARMVVDGTLTDASWPEHPPMVYRIGRQTFILRDLYSGAGDFVWDGDEKKLTPFGGCDLHRVPGAGMVITRRTYAVMPAVEVLDFPAENRKPRVLWCAEGSGLAPLGVWEAAVVFVLGGKRLLLLEPGWPAKEIDIDLGKFRWQATGDGIRRGKALLLGELPLASGRRKEYTAPVAVINLKTREIKPIGDIPGSWTSNTAAYHAIASASWITQEQADKLPRNEYSIASKLFGSSHSYVIEETDQIVK